ncbi:MAG TPA: hypothetical protein VJA18_02390 [Candidatus Nanoarchaeia archaeon]|nr:hypothetical protein [Candidatus Nanoarchaeia archaeon]
MAKKKDADIIPTIVFIASSFILFVNNLTQFFINYGISVKENINILSWFGIGISVTWWIYLSRKGVFR